MKICVKKKNKKQKDHTRQLNPHAEILLVDAVWSRKSFIYEELKDTFDFLRVKAVL